MLAEPALLAVLVWVVEEDGHHEVGRGVVEAGALREVGRVARPDAGTSPPAHFLGCGRIRRRLRVGLRRGRLWG